VLATALPAASTYFIDYTIIHGLCINLFRFVWCVARLHIVGGLGLVANSLGGLSTAVTLGTTQDVRDTLFWQNPGLLVTYFAQCGLALSVSSLTR
jgi:hypothetical protein